MNDSVSEALTERERTILKLIADGLSNRQIADELLLALDTVKWYTKRIYEKLGVSSRTQAISEAKNLALLDTQSDLSLTNTLTIRPQVKQNLPIQTTPFVGREIELAELNQLLGEPRVRLLTLVAAGGMGKTRLAVEAASSQTRNFADGVYFIALAPLNSFEHIVKAISDAVGFQFYGSGEPKEQLLNYLHNKAMLLVIDNFEHLLEGAELASDILFHALKTKIIITSREVLNLQEEFLYTVKGMRFPQYDELEVIEGFSAVRLFIQHASRIRPDFSLQGEATGIARICRLVEGMPLGIELAAAWVRVLSCAEIANEIEQSLDILASPLRNVAERHRSMRAVLEQSWKRISEEERTVFRKLSVFRGGFTRQAAHAVSEASLSTLAALVDKSLLHLEPTGRYEVHELLRQYGQEQLETAQEMNAVQDAHSTYFATFMAQREPDLKGRRQKAALDEIESDLANIGTAWNWAADHENRAAINQFVESLFLYSEMRGVGPEGKKLYQHAQVHLAANPDDEMRAIWERALTRGIWLKILQWELDEADKAHIPESLTVAQQDNDLTQVGFCLWLLGFDYFEPVFNPSSIARLHESLALFTELDDRFYMARVADWIGAAYELNGQLEECVRFTQQSVDLRRDLGDKFGVASALRNLTEQAMQSGQYHKTAQYLHEISAIYRELGIERWMSRTNALLARLTFQIGDFQQAQTLAEEALKIAKDLDILNTEGGKFAAITLGMLATLNEDYARSWELCYSAIHNRPHPIVYATCREGLTIAACGLADYSTAKKYLLEALKPAIANRDFRE